MNDIVITSIVLFVLAAATGWVTQRLDREEQRLVWFSFAAHQISAIAMILMIRLYYGGGDMIAYHAYGVMGADLLRDNFFELLPVFVGGVFQQAPSIPIPIGGMSPSPTGSMQALSALAMLVFADSLYGICAFIAGLATFSKLGLYLVARDELPDLNRRSLLISCLLLPSAVFWSSALLKEPLAMIGLYMAVFGGHRLVTRPNKIGALLTMSIGVLIAGLIKGYLVPVFGIAAAFWLTARSLNARRVTFAVKLGHVILASVLATGVVFATGALMPEYAPENLETEIANAQLTGTRFERGSYYSLGEPTGETGGRQIALAPLALLTSLTRPFFFEVTNPLMLLNAVETLVFSILLVMGLFRRSIRETVAELFRQPLLGFSAVFVLIFATGVGLATFNLGTLSRYRAPMMPLYAILLTGLVARVRKVSPAPNTLKPLRDTSAVRTQADRAVPGFGP